MKKLAILLAFLVFGVSVAIAGTDDKLTKIDIEGLKALKASKESFVLIDSRGGKWFDGEVIEGAVNLPVDAQTPEKLAEIVPSKDMKVVFYCTNTACNASELGAHKAIDAGYKNVIKYPGGIEEWKQNGQPVSKL